jgi:hypothetical protein
MKRTLTLAAGMAVGYVAGAKAGREKYDQMHQKVREISEKPTVAEVRRSLRERVDTASKTVTDKITDLAAPSSKESDGADDQDLPAVEVVDVFVAEPADVSRPRGGGR